MGRPIRVDVHFTSEFHLMTSNCQKAVWPQWYSSLVCGHRQIPARLTEALAWMAFPHQSKSAAGFGSGAIYILGSTEIKYNYNGINNNSINQSGNQYNYISFLQDLPNKEKL